MVGIVWIIGIISAPPTYLCSFILTLPYFHIFKFYSFYFRHYHSTSPHSSTSCLKLVCSYHTLILTVFYLLTCL